jgi:hypothetical protein
MTIAVNNLSKQWSPELEYAVKTNGTADINQGDLVYFDATDHVVLPLDSDAHAATLAGVANQSSVLNVYGNKVYSDSGTIVVGIKGQYSFATTVGDTYTDGDAVYLGADCQTVTNTAGAMTHPLGYVKLSAGQASLVGAAGVKVAVNIVPQFPVAGGL